MKREELRKLGLTDEQVDAVMSINGDDVNAQKAIVAQRDETITTLTTERDGLRNQVADRDKDISTLRESAGNNEALTKQLNELQQKYTEDTEKLQQSLDKQARSHAVEGLFSDIEFTSAMAKRAAIREFEALGLEFKDGKYVGADDAIKKMRTENADAFKVKEKEKGQTTPPPDPPKFTNPNGSGESGEGGNTNPFNFGFNAVRNSDKK